jgi:superfamily I DNA/RNA helicase
MKALMDNVEDVLAAATTKILESDSRKKLIVAGPGAGKTTIFKRLLEGSQGNNNSRLVLTFINNLKNSLEEDLSDLASIFTLHGYCQSLLHEFAPLRDGLTEDFRCLPKLASLIKHDWEYLHGEPSPQFVGMMRDLTIGAEWDFYKARADYYDAVDFDDSVYRIYRLLDVNPKVSRSYDLILIDEFQDFNRLEAGLIACLSIQSPIVIAGDDDQALYSKLKGASWEFIRAMYREGEYEIFELPFCMRCPEVIVDAVNDVLLVARREERLDGRIEKPFAHYFPVKGVDSEKYPLLDLVTTSVQRGNANYFGRYIEQEILKIPDDEIEGANTKGEPAVMIIGSKPYLPQVAKYLRSKGFEIETNEGDGLTLDKSQGLEILSVEPASNLGWRIILEFEAPAIARVAISAAYETASNLVEVIPGELKRRILEEVSVWSQAAENQPESTHTAAKEEPPYRIKLTSFEGSKGLSAQHVFIIGMHEGEIPHDVKHIDDIEICRFLVGLTRAKKKCSLLLTRRFGENWKQPSIFLSWIEREKFNEISVDANYWKN